MSVYLVMAVEVTDSELYAKYVAGAAKALKPFNLTRLSADSEPTVYEGRQPANRLAIIEFESQEKFDEFYRSDAYQEVIGLRLAAADTKFIMTMKPPAG